jgi:hypothetical protein
MKIETNLPLVEDILKDYRGIIGSDFAGYRNHVYRVINLCFSIGTFGEIDKEKIQIAACFHDIGIWTAGSLDYLPPSELEATKYLQATGKEEWVPEIVEMIEMHHGICSRVGSKFPLVEIFRRADIADFSLGTVLMGISRELLSQLKLELPNAGFHKRLLQLGCKWFLKHPLNPLPMFRR